MTAKTTHHTKGFSLIEVILALGLIAVALPTLLGVFGYLSESSMKTKDRDDVESVTSAVQLYLETEAGTANSGTASVGGTFPVVYDWVKSARDTPQDAKILYVYKFIVDESEVVSETPPNDAEISNVDSRLMIVELHAPDESILPTAELPTDFNEFSRAYLPLQLRVFTVLTADETRGNFNLLESIPIVLSR